MLKEAEARSHQWLPALTAWIVLTAGLAAPGCAWLSRKPIAPALDVTGFWQGRSFGTCAGRMPGCAGMSLISLSMIQDESKISGMYRCATGTTLCRNLDTQGNIAVGNIRGPGVSLRIMFDDVSSCIFNGTFSGNVGGGAYICMQGGGTIDRGFWNVRRSFGPPPPPAWWTG
jgi:hypothetical protein